MPFRKLFIAALFLPLVGRAQNLTIPGLPGQGEPVTVTLVAEQKAVVPGKPFTVAVRIEHEEHWHTFWRNSGKPAQPTTIKWTLPEGFKAADPLWPVPKVVPQEFGIHHLHEGTIYILTDITPPATLKAGESVKLGATVKYQFCREDECRQGSESLSLTLPMADTAEKDPAQTAAFDAVRKVQPQPTTAWKVSVSPDGANWKIRAEPGEGAAADPGTVYFLDAVAAISNDPQEWKKDGAALVLTIAKEDEDSATVPWGWLQASGSWLSGSQVPLLAVGAPPGASATAPAPAETTSTPPPGAAPAGVDEQIALIRSWGIRPLGGVAEGANDSLTWPLAILFAFLGGMILNLMPCVFPVLGIKILGFVRQSGEDTAIVKKHGLVYAAGVIASVLALTGVLLAVRVGSENAGWGFQLQNPLFLVFLIVLVFAFSLNMAGVFELGTSLTGVGAELQDKSGYKGSFFSGLLTVLLATPCTGPFMGPALGFALSKDTPMLLVVAVFTALAIGLALPYVVLSWFPALIKKLPRPGAWMETFKQFMSFPMFATAIWLLTVFASVTGPDGMRYMLFALVLLAMSLWLYGRFGNPSAKPRSRRLGLTTALLAVVSGGWLAWSAAQEKAPALASGGHDFSPQTIIERRARGETTVLDCWAKWCLQCELNRKAAFDREEFTAALPKYKAHFMLGDQTQTNESVEKLLAAYHSGGIPFAIIIPPTGPAIELPRVLTSPDTLIQGLEEAKRQAQGK